MNLIYYTDGGCYPNPGNGTWAFVCTEPYIEVSGSEKETTNNRMEIMAIMEAIKHGLSLKAEKIHIFTDSQYCQMAFTFWIEKWAKKAWKDKKNVDLFKELLRIKMSNKGKIEVHWVKGHNGNEYNEIADKLVRQKYSDTFGGEMAH